MKITRRSFLKSSVAVSAVLSIPAIAGTIQAPSSQVVIRKWGLPAPSVKKQPVLEKTGGYGLDVSGDSMVREIIAYSIGDDKYIARFDIFDGKEQYRADCEALSYKCRDRSAEGRQYVRELRELVYPLLAAQMRAKGISYGDLKYLPVPEGATSLKEFDL